MNKDYTQLAISLQDFADNHALIAYARHDTAAIERAQILRAQALRLADDWTFGVLWDLETLRTMAEQDLARRIKRAKARNA